MSPASGRVLCRSTFSRGESGKAHSIRLSNTEWQSRPHRCISLICLKKPTEFRSHSGCTVQQRRGRKRWSPGAKLRIQSFPSVCSQVGWQGASAGWWLSGGSDSLSQGDHCHMPVCPQRWRLTRPTRPGPLVMPSLSAVGRLWQLTRHLGHGRQGPERCYLYRHQDLLLPRRRVWRRRRRREHTQFIFNKRITYSAFSTLFIYIIYICLQLMNLSQ